MKKLAISAVLFLFTSAVFAQKTKQAAVKNSTVQKATKVHKVVFQLSTDDSVVHKSLMKQLNNILTAAPGTKIEIVCHGPGIYLLVKDKTIVQDKIEQMKKRGVIFMACENTLQERKIAKDKIVPESGFVPSALIEIITKEEEGWSYIKSGF